ncbi:hypothetical protein D3C72_1208540 [compost metagenome]
MRVDRIVLEDHGDVALFRFLLVDDVSADLQRAIGNFFEPCDHAQCRRFSAAGRADKNDEFAVFNGKVDTFDRLHLAVALHELIEFDCRHYRAPVRAVNFSASSAAFAAS